MFPAKILQNCSSLRGFASSSRRGLTVGRIYFNKPAMNQSSAEPNLSKVTGLSSKVIAPAQAPVGPGASKDSNYKNPEYFLYNRMSYFEAEIEMANYRCPQPSNKTYYK